MSGMVWNEGGHLTFVIISNLAEEVERTRGSLRGAVDGGAEILVRDTNDGSPWRDATGESVVLVRGGDLIDGDAVVAACAKEPEATAIVGGHRLRAPRRWGDEILPPWDGLLTDESLAVDCPIELSALIIRRDALPESVSPSPASPGGDVALFVDVARRVGLTASSHIVAEVRAGPLHRGDAAAALDRLHGVLHSSVGLSEAARSRVRRRALMVAYHDGDERLRESFSARHWWLATVERGDPPEVMATLMDLQWALARTANAMHLVSGGMELVGATAPSDFDEPTLLVEEMHAEWVTANRLVEERQAAVQRLHAEVAVRDRLLAQLSEAVADRDNRLAERAADCAPAERGARIDETPGKQLLIIAASRMVRRLRRR